MTVGGTEDCGRAPAKSAARPAVPPVPTKLARLFADNYWRIHAVAMNVVEDEETALEVVHDSFIIMYTQWKRLRLAAMSPEALESYLIEVVEDTALQAIRQKRRGPVPSGLELDRRVDRTETLALTNSSSIIVIGELARLPRRQQEVLALTIDGYAPFEIAGILGIEANAVRVHLHLARVKIRAWLESTGILAA